MILARVSHAPTQQLSLQGLHLQHHIREDSSDDEVYAKKVAALAGFEATVDYMIEHMPPMLAKYRAILR